MNLPTYIENPDQGNYNEELNQTLREGLSDNGWTVPNQSTANITTIEPQMPIGSIWFDTNLAKLVVKTAAGVVEVIQSV